MSIANLIQKPYGPLIAVLGFVPYSFKKKAIHGHEIECRITALLWNFSRKHGGKHTSVEFNFPLVTLMRDTILSTARNCSKNFSDKDEDGE